jgi:hypothetical protein
VSRRQGRQIVGAEEWEEGPGASDRKRGLVCPIEGRETRGCRGQESGIHGPMSWRSPATGTGSGAWKIAWRPKLRLVSVGAPETRSIPRVALSIVLRDSCTAAETQTVSPSDEPNPPPRTASPLHLQLLAPYAIIHL